MKKIVCILLTLVMVMSLSVVAFAENGSETNSTGSGSKDITVNGTITLDEEVNKSAAKYEITIEWNISGSTGGTKIQKKSEYKWDSTQLKYTLDDSDISYDRTQADQISGTITVTNKSNADIGYAITWAADSGLTEKGVTVYETGSGVENTKLARADQAFVTATAVDGEYNITPTNLGETTGEATSAECSVNLSWTASEYGTLYTDTSITLGKYTVTIGAAPTT